MLFLVKNALILVKNAIFCDKNALFLKKLLILPPTGRFAYKDSSEGASVNKKKLSPMCFILISMEILEIERKLLNYQICNSRIIGLVYPIGTILLLPR